MVQSTSKHDSTTPPQTHVPNSRELETARVLEAQFALRSNLQSTAQAQSWQDRAGPMSVTTEVVTALEAAAFAAAVAAERALSFAAVLDEALAVLADAGRPHPALPPSRDLSPYVAFLSPREREVLALVAAGHTNKAIADLLFVSPNTIKTHVASLLTKLQADSRVQLAAIAARQGLG